MTEIPAWERRYIVMNPQNHEMVVMGTLQDMQDCFGFDVDYLSGEDVTPELVLAHCVEKGWTFFQQVSTDAEIVGGSAAITPERLEAACRLIATKHYASRFKKAEDDPHVVMNVNGNWNIFEHDARLAIEGFLAAA